MSDDTRPLTPDPLATLLGQAVHELTTSINHRLANPVGLDEDCAVLGRVLVARLTDAGVTLTQPQPETCGDTRPKGHARCLQPKGHAGDHATARRDVTWPQTLTQPQPDARPTGDTAHPRYRREAASEGGGMVPDPRGQWVHVQDLGVTEWSLDALDASTATPPALDVERLARLEFPGPGLDSWQKGWNAAIRAAIKGDAS